MKKYLSLKYLTTVCFVALVGTMLIYTLRPTFYVAYHQLENLRSGSGFSREQAEYEYNDSLPGKEFYITFNGAFQRLMGIRNVNDRYRMDNGHLTYVVPEMDVQGIAENTVYFRDALEEMGIPFAYVCTPFKIDPEDKQLPLSVEDYSNENADDFLAVLEENSVQHLDLRKLEKEQGLDHYSLYFLTDHHWKPETGFWAYTQIASWLASLDEGFAVDPAITDPENYTYTVYEDIFCGSAARRVGPLYAGLDDVTVISPVFETWLNLSVPSEELYRQGSYEDTLLFPEHLTTERPLESAAYGVYLNKDEPKLFVTNESRQRNLPVKSQPQKLMILKDSNSLVVAPYMALSYDEICLVDLRLFEGDFLGFIREYQPDMVLTIYNPGAFEEHNRSMFDYFR